MTNEKFEKLVYLFHLLNIEGVGPQKVFSLLSKFERIENIFTSNNKELVGVEGINKVLSIKILDAAKNISTSKIKVEKELEYLSKINGSIVTYWSSNYPVLLKNIYYPPLLLYMIGSFSNQDSNSVAIVGTRKPTHYGKNYTEIFSRELSQNKITIVSGMARGIDSIAHKAALKANGRTIAVIGSGLNVIYPPENKNLYEEISKSGVIISEYPIGTKPDAQNFPRRNRIIAGLSLGTLVIESGINGGAMQTATYAMDQNREVFAVPGNINSKQSEGSNLLIQRSQAKLVNDSDDILTELNLKLKPEVGKNIPMPAEDLTFFEESILKILNTNPIHIDDIATLSSMSVSDCLVNLLTLEFKGLVKQLPGKNFMRI